MAMSQSPGPKKKGGEHALPLLVETRAFRFHEKPFQVVLSKYEEIGVGVSFGPIKKLYRLIEKMMRPGNSVMCASILDVVRAMIVCDTNELVCKVLKKLAEDESITICKVKEGYSRHKFGEWVDVKLIVYLNGKPGGVKQKWHDRQHKCELQIVHNYMKIARTDMGGHKAYNKHRSLGGALKALSTDDGTSEFSKLESQLLAIMARGNPTEIARIGRIMDIGNAIGASAVTMHQPADDLAYLAQYPNISLDEYKDDKEFWFINKQFPGLRAIAKDPWIFLVPNLLTREQCYSLMMKGGPHVVQSKSYVDGKLAVSEARTSWEVRVPREEVPNLQSIFGKLLNMPTENMEPLKVLRYKKKEHFQRHSDAPTFACKRPQDGLPYCRAPHANRVVTLFVYLNTPENGGETHFMKCGVKVQPRAGMGVIHFPAYLASSSSYVGPDDPKSIVPGLKVIMKRDPNAALGTAGAALSVGTVTEVKIPMAFGKPQSNGTATITNDITEREKSYKLLRMGDITLEGFDFNPLPNMKGEIDGRVIHEGMDACDEKYLATQWCWPGEFFVEKAPTTYHAKPLNESAVL
jgi:hypothetical protein